LEDKFAANAAKDFPFAPFVVEDKAIPKKRGQDEQVGWIRPAPDPTCFKEFLNRVKEDIETRDSKKKSWKGPALSADCTFEPKLDKKAASLQRSGSFADRMAALAAEHAEKLQARRDEQYEQIKRMARVRASPFMKPGR
jgi:hypothetical protein